MSTAAIPQAIPGAETQAEGAIISRWPSIASTAIGRVIGGLLEAAPTIRLPGLNINLAYAPVLLLAPVAAAVYLLTKFIGRRYTVTSKRVMVQHSLSKSRHSQVAREDISEVAIAPYRTGQEFFAAADVVLQGGSGEELMRMQAVTRPGVFRQNILESRDALIQVQAALATIQARSDG